MNEAKIQNKLIELRARKKITQDTLAAYMGVSRQTIISIEKGAYTPSLPLALNLGVYFAMPIEDIFYIETPTS
jgi:putative transcriptional regulator